MNLIELEEILQELKQHCVGGWIQKIHQPLPNTLTFDIRVPGQSLTLLICIDPQFARIHFASKKLENPPTPPAFCQFLRTHLEGGRIEHISQEPQDRVVYMSIATASSRDVLVVALTGNKSNVYLLNESRKVMQGLKVSWLKIGEEYAPPTQDKRVPHSLLNPPSFAESSPRLRTGKSVDEVKANKGEKEEFLVRFPFSAKIEERYWKKEQNYLFSQARSARLSKIQKALKQANRKIKSLEEDLQKAERYREYGRYGELLKGQLSSLTKGQSSVTVVDYYDTTLPQLTLPLDPSKDPVWNMEDYFKKHHKFLSAEKHLGPRLEKARQEVLELQEELEKLKEMDGFLSEMPLPAFENRKKMRMPSDKKTKPQPAPAAGYRQFVSIDGLPLLVGKTAKDNDVLTFKVSGPDDLWLHARGTPGSHVVVRLEKGPETPHETLKDAATLALWFSDLRKSGKGEVIYTHRKFVKKARGQKAGTVTVSREKSIWIEIKEERLARLKESSK